MTKKATILQHAGGGMGSQLWNYISAYAYCLERKIDCENYSFFEFAEFFPELAPKNIFIKTIFFLPLSKHGGKRYVFLLETLKIIYSVFVFFIKLTNKDSILNYDDANKDSVFYLPPSAEPREINILEKKKVFYFDKKILRNPKGIEKYRNEITAHFRPNKKIEMDVAKKLSNLRSNYENIIGVHIRQGGYRSFKRGKFFVDQGHMRTFIDQFIEKFKIDIKKTCFYITSDSPLEEKFFSGLCYKIGAGDPATELFTLSGTDAIIGSDSHFGSFASYYGNIPHIVCHRSEIDWKYYLDKSTFFHNKYWKIPRG